MYERRLPVESYRAVNEHVFVLEFRSPEIASAARAGQFLMLAPAPGIDPLLRRPMAVYEIADDGDGPSRFSVLIERMGRGTRLLGEMRPGDEISILGPLGGAFDVPADPEMEAVLVMGGVGSAPFPLFARDLRAAGRQTRAFIGGRDASRLLCAEDFEALGVEVALATDDGSAGHHGLVTEPLLAYLDRADRPVTLYSCGPTPMMRAVDAIATRRGLPHVVSLEAPMACGIGVCLSCVVPFRQSDGSWRYRRVCREGPVFDTTDMLWEHPDA